MNVKKLALGAYQTNCYLLWEGDLAVVIDPGYEPDTILRALQTLGMELKAILLTHGHFDHVGGVREIAEQTGASTATISRVNHSLSYGAGGYQKVLAKLGSQ